MSAYLVGRVLRAAMPIHLKPVAALIADYANDEGYAFPGQERIAEDLGQSVRQVARNIRELEKRGFLSVLHRGRKGQSRSGGRTSNGYQFDMGTLPHPTYQTSECPISEETTDGSEVIRHTSQLSGEVIGQASLVSDEVIRHTGQLSCGGYRTSWVGLSDIAMSYEPSVEPSDKEYTSKPASRIPTCPHLEIIEIYHRVLPELPRVVESRWKGSASERNLKARWTEAEKHQSLKFWEGLFGVVRTNNWWMGRGDWKGANLHWLVKRSNFDKVIEHGINLNRETKDDAC